MLLIKLFASILEAYKYYCGIYAKGSSWSYNYDDEVKTKYTAWVTYLGVSKPGYTGSYAGKKHLQEVLMESVGLLILMKVILILNQANMLK